MAAIMYTIFSIGQVASIHCSVRREISPCTCAPDALMPETIIIKCERVDSFNQVFDALQNKFNPELNIWLTITHSQLDDLETRTFSEMNIKIKNLRLNHNQLRALPDSSFRNLSNLQFLSLADNELEEVPRHLFTNLHDLGTLDLASGRINSILRDDFRNLPNVTRLVLVSNSLQMLEKDSIPKTIKYLHLGKNNLTSLNGTLREVKGIEVLFLNGNSLVSLDDELPVGSKHLAMVIAHHNRLEKLPDDFKTMKHLVSLYFDNNKLKSLDGNLKHANLLERFYANNNFITYLREDEFLEAGILESLDLSYNRITSLNNSLIPLKSIRSANFSNNLLTEFSMTEIRGLRELIVLDLGHNRIEKLSGRMENIVESEIYVNEIRLENNLLKTLNGAMIGLNRLRTLSLAHNSLHTISPDDLIGLEKMEILDISHNNLQTLEETSKSFLPKLSKLNASYNNLTKLEKDFHGLPVLCWADLSNNRITSISTELVAKTRCSNHGVVSKLEIVLQENPILCQDEVQIQRLTAEMEAQEARLLGIAHCIVRHIDDSEGIMADPKIFPTPKIPISTILNQQMLLPNTIPHQYPAVVRDTPSIVKIIMPAQMFIQQEQQQQLLSAMPPIVTTTQESILTTVQQSTVPVTAVPSTSTEQTFTESSTSEEISSSTNTTPTMSTIQPSTTTPVQILSSSAAAPSTMPTETTSDPPISNANSPTQTTDVFVEIITLPSAVDNSALSTTKATPIETDDNVVHETFSPVPTRGGYAEEELIAQPQEPPELLQLQDESSSIK